MQRLGMWRFVVGALLTCVLAVSAAAAEAPARPAIVALEIEPAAVTLHDALDARKVLVFGLGADGQRYDLTAEATLTPDAPNVKVDGDGYLVGNMTGETNVTISAAGKSIALPVKVAGVDDRPIGFVRDVMPVLAKAGCNSGTCHGAQDGKNGFKLSLRGYDPDYDYQQLISDLSGRRFNRVRPEQSLMLLKPLGEVPHEGQQVITPGSRHYDILLQWIKQGTQSESPAARARSIEVFPKEVALDLAGRSQQVIVTATYADGSTRDVTREAVISTSNIEVATAEGNTVTGLRRGESGVLVRYEGNYATALITVMGDRAGYEWVQRPVYNEIDEYVDTKLKKVKAIPSELCDDATFLRRAYLDLTGIPPSHEVARAHVED